MPVSRAVCRRQLLAPCYIAGRLPLPPPPPSRSFGSSAANNDRSIGKATHPPESSSISREFDSRWLSTIKARLGKCLTFGLQPHQVTEAGEILQVIARDWRELTAGSEGFLTGEQRRGLFQHNVVWGEMDTMNSLTPESQITDASKYAETARVNWTRNFGIHIDRANQKAWFELLGSTAIGLILKSIKIDYKFPMVSPDKITVYHKLSRPQPPPSSPSHSSIQLDVLILSEAHQRPAARCHEDIVTYDYRLGRKVKTLPPFMLDQFQHTWELQQESRQVWRSKVKEIEGRVKALETSSWDRADAVEDMGSSG
ncbi:hypothetical protein FQN53_002732 [Emmonsiellopsis sp. PD_33]|nr:hypothetical protein FQN53_002732 [Emmonsiellopsis sp. PD_33]KAK2797221.1 hypothetical protein FQN51_008744 [Onygenales sp. PD_10]